MILLLLLLDLGGGRVVRRLKSLLLSGHTNLNTELNIIFQFNNVWSYKDNLKVF